MPQGTIPRGDAFHDTKLTGRAGVVRLSNMTGVPILPVGLQNKEAVWPRSAKVPSVWNITDPPRVQLRVGTAVGGLRGTPKTEAKDLDLVMRSIEKLLLPE
jgi:putative phosphoserine phosphatase / 1-acylglycerol-3-phosphate O-acyltransferase